MDHADVVRATKCAARYRDLGLSPLPSRSDRKRPTLHSYAEHRTEPLPEAFFRDWGAVNIQLMTGVAAYGSTKIIVVDCDGSMAIETWARMCKDHQYEPDTWNVETGSGGLHVYFQLPSGTDECKSGLIWGLWDTYGRGTWVKHQEIRILGENSLAVAPPSVHVGTGRRYKFIDSGSPLNSTRPEVAPSWLLGMRRLEPLSDRVPNDTSREQARPSPLQPACDHGFSSDQVLDAIHDKLAVAMSWGLRVTGRKGYGMGDWVECRAVDRPDNHPSCSFCVGSGAYFDHGTNQRLSLFDLGAALGVFDDWRQCRAWCASQFLPQKPAFR